MIVYIVVCSEATNCVDEAFVDIRGVYTNKEDAFDRLYSLRNNSLLEFKDEYVSFENRSEVVIKKTKDDNYLYKIEVFKRTIS